MKADNGSKLEAAAEWFGRREVGLTAAEEREFQQWLGADPQHGECFQEFESTWSEMDLLAESTMTSKLPTRTTKRLRWVWWPVGLAAAAALMLTLWPAANPRFVHYTVATETGGLRKLELPDGSVIRMNASTEVEVDLRVTERRIALLKGEAFFTVAKDASRPFIVSAAGLTVRAVGTAFNVALSNENLEVRVTEGKVTVEETGRSVLAVAQNDGTPPVLEAGQMVTLGLKTEVVPSALPVVAPEPEMSKALAWQAKMLEFDREPLSRVVAEFNRYNQHQLVIADEQLGQRVFGGTFRADSYEVMVELLESRFGVIAERQGDRTVLRLRK